MGGDAFFFQHFEHVVGHAVVDGAFAQDGAFFLAVKGSGVVLVVHDDHAVHVGGEHFFCFSLIELFKFFHDDFLPNRIQSFSQKAYVSISFGVWQ